MKKSKGRVFLYYLTYGVKYHFFNKSQFGVEHKVLFIIGELSFQYLLGKDHFLFKEKKINKQLIGVRLMEFIQKLFSQSVKEFPAIALSIYELEQLLRADIYGIIRQWMENLQMDTDDIVEKEVRFFVWVIPVEWSFLVVPVYRKEEFLYLGIEKKFYFEKEEWVKNYFDGRK